MLKFVLIIVLLSNVYASPITTRPSVPTDTILTLTSTPISVSTPPKIPTPTAYTTSITTTSTTPTTTSKKVPPAKGDGTIDSISVTVVTVVFCVIIALFLFLCCLSANKREKELLYNSPYTYFVK